MTNNKGLIITHGGSAHFDDFFSTCLVIYKCSVDENYVKIGEVHRRELSKEERRDPGIWKLDVGRGFNPELKLFDHHPEFTNNGTLLQSHHELMDECTFSLLLREWGVWEQAIKIFKWLSIARIMDTKGPIEVVKNLDITFEGLNSLRSFIERSVLKLFQQYEVIKSTEPFFTLLRFIGQEFFEGIYEYNETLSRVEENLLFRTIKNVPIIECLKGIEPTNSLYQILSQKKRNKWGLGGIAIYPNNRPLGSIAVKRYDNDTRIDFTRIANYEKVIFAHPNGFFVAIDGKISNNELDQYIKDAIET